MELLIKRDGNQLVQTGGESFVDSDVPNYLQVPRVVLEEQIERFADRNSNDDLIIENESDYHEIKNHLSFDPNSNGAKNPLLTIPGLWSGYRSTILQDPRTKKWFRIKGVAFNPYNPEAVTLENGDTRISGGQHKHNTEYEKEMSDRFNKTLEDVGIEPVMQVRGIWKYPVVDKRINPAASIVEIKGDTRLDELMVVTENLMSNKMYIGGKVADSDGNLTKRSVGALTNNGKKFESALKNLYYDIGFVTGRLKNLMDKGGQTWSTGSDQSNAHVGNIVIYNGTDKLKVGFVDFDMSSNKGDFSLSQLKALQQREYETIIGSAIAGAISPRQMDGLPFEDYRKVLERKGFIEGFEKGYESISTTYNNEVDFWKLQEVFELLRQ